MVIWKYELAVASLQTVEIPRDFRIIHVDNQGGRLCMWAEVFPDNPKTKITLRIVGTGHTVEDDLAEHLGTVLMGQFVWHVYRV